MCIAIYHTAILFIATLGGFANAQISVSAFYPAFKTVVKNFEYNLCFVIIVMAKCLFPASVKF